MRRIAAWCAALWLGCATATPALAQTPRTLVYDITLTSHTTRDDPPGTGEMPAASRRRAPPSAVERSIDINDDGTLTIMAIAATRDRGLVVDVAYRGNTTAQPLVRTGITAEGELLYDPHRPLSPAARRVLPYLSLGFTGERDVSPGSEWTIAAPQPAHGSTTYSVTRSTGALATIALAGSFDVPGTFPYTETARGTMEYALARGYPQRLALETNVLRTRGVDELVRERTTLVATLRSDSFDANR